MTRHLQPRLNESVTNMPMEQRDYILREIEKIGLMLRMLLQKITRREEKEGWQDEALKEEARGMLLEQAGLDLDLFFSLEKSEMEQYISTWRGVNGANMELLAELLNAMALKPDGTMDPEYLQRALKLYELCNSMERTFSLEREGKIQELKKSINARQ